MDQSSSDGVIGFSDTSTAKVGKMVLLGDWRLAKYNGPWKLVQFMKPGGCVCVPIESGMGVNNAPYWHDIQNVRRLNGSEQVY
ncbi:MAG: hypothetical protein L0H29_02980 [Sinobacteraceae bacterium]|nr:hypothetical protein [Nevskiaceae bacterium]